MNVIVSPTRSPIRGILAMPITDATVLDLTCMQVKRCLRSGAIVYRNAAQGNNVSCKEQITMLNVDEIFGKITVNKRLPLPTVDVPKTVKPAIEEKKEDAPQQKHMTKAERRKARREAEAAAAAALEATTVVEEDEPEDEKENED